MITAIVARLAPYKLLLQLAAILALVAGAAYGVHQFLEHERDIGRKEVQAQWDAQKASDKLAADKLESDWQARWYLAVNQGNDREKSLRTDAAVARTSADKLRDTNATLQQRLATAPAETARQYAATYAAVFTDCEGRYRAMGEAAQGHANDSLTLQQAWPTNAQPAK